MVDSEYLTGFGSYFESEAVAGSLPIGQNSPKKSPKGLYPEQLSGSPFTMKRAENLRTWLYRIQPSVVHKPFIHYNQDRWFAAKKGPEATSPNQWRWLPPPEPLGHRDFLDGVVTMVTTQKTPGCAAGYYYCNQGMGDKFFYNSDGELLLLPEKGSLEVLTEMGRLVIAPLEIAVIPRGIKFQIKPLQEGWCRGYLAENTGRPFVLPELGPLGANGLANPRDFYYPQAKFFNQRGSFTLVTKFCDNFFQADIDHHPLDVVAWHGNYAPYKYDLRRFNTMGTVSYDHPDPSIYTVLTSPSEAPGMANCDFVIFPPRWLVGEKTFRPPYYHRNFMNEYMGLLVGEYDAKQGGFIPGGSSLHNCMTAHGPDGQSFKLAVDQAEGPQKVADTMAFMLETHQVFHPTKMAMTSPALDKDYYECWQDLVPKFKE